MAMSSADGPGAWTRRSASIFLISSAGAQSAQAAARRASG